MMGVALDPLLFDRQARPKPAFWKVLDQAGPVVGR